MGPWRSTSPAHAWPVSPTGANLLVSDLIVNEDTFADKQTGLATSSMFVAASRSLTVRMDIKTSDLKKPLKTVEAFALRDVPGGPG